MKIAELTAFLQGPESSKEQDNLLYQWAKRVECPARRGGFQPPALISLDANYRQIEKPVLQTVTNLQSAFPDRLIAILIPETIKSHWWQTFLHVGYTNHLRSILLKDKIARLVVIDVPWHLDD